MALLLVGATMHADEPYARSKDYDLQNIRTHLWFNLAQRSIRGEADESIAASRDDVAQIKLDSVGLTIEAVTVDAISENLYTSGQPDPDLVIRTSGEQRLSGFLLWQSAYSEMWFTEAHWPAFRRVDFLRALRDYSLRHRRYGM